MQIINICMNNSACILQKNIIVWCHPRSGSHNLMARLRNSFLEQGVSNVGSLYEMFPDHNGLVGKEYHSEFILKEVANRRDCFTNGMTWQLHQGLFRTVRQPDWCYLDELEKRLHILESQEVVGPTIGKHITWWNLYTDVIRGSHESFVARAHSAVAGIADYNIVLYRHGLEDFAASTEVLNFSFQDAGARRYRIKTHGPVEILEDEQIVHLQAERIERYIQRLIAGFAYLDKTKTVMIRTEELSQVQKITWPDGTELDLSQEGVDLYRNSYARVQHGQKQSVNRALDVVSNPEEITAWANAMREKYAWDQLREQHGFSRGF
jgi:hypothetical protein